MNERVDFVSEWSKLGRDFAAHCRRFGVSRKTGYKWLERYEQEGPRGLEDRRPLALHHPNQTPDEVVGRVLRLRKQHPLWGPKKLHGWLKDHEPGGGPWPKPTTIGDMLKRHGLIRPQRRRLRVPFNLNPLDPCAAPNDVWATDFKGQFRLGDGALCYPLTLMDACSRYLLKCEALPSTKGGPVKEHFELAFREFGLPLKVRSDNGSPFATVGPGGLSALSVWWIRLGIAPERIDPGEPQQNGRHERMHRTLSDHAACPPAKTMPAQQLKLDEFRGEYNEDRPHEALGQKPPASVHTLSLREYAGRERAPEYAWDWKVRRVYPDGVVRWKGATFSVGQVLGGEPVGMHEVDEDRWDVHYGPVRLGTVIRGEGGAQWTRA